MGREAVKATNENLLTCAYVQAYAYARNARGCARLCFIGEGDGKVGRNEKENGGGSEEGGVNEGRKGNQWKMKVRKMGEKGKHEMKKPSRCAKRGERREKWKRFLEKVSEVGFKTRKDEKKVDFAGQKNERDSSKKCPKSGSKRGKAGKTEILERKRWGGGAAEKWALLPILPCYEVAKWVQMKISRIFFRRSLAGNAGMLYLCTRNREATLLQERVTL